MKSFLRSRSGIILLVVLIAFILRFWAAFRLPTDFDEPIYLNAALDYAQMFRGGNLNAVIDYPEIREHPPLVRLIYGLSMLPLGVNVGRSDALAVARFVSVIFGTLSVWVVALFDPLSGFLMAISTYMVKYTSQAYLEALPLFTSMLALFILFRSKNSHDRYFWISAGALGVTAAGKYSYFPIFLVILFVYFLVKKYPWRDLLLYLSVTILIFFVLDPVLWRNPFTRLYESIFFHPQYAQGSDVQLANYPWYQPIIWLSSSKPYEWHRDVFLYNPAEGIFSIDAIIFLAALIAIPQQWRERRWVLFWMVSGVLLLLLWPTKWPQYTLVVIPAFCLAASASLKRLGRFIKNLDDYYDWSKIMIPIPDRVFWVIFLGILGIFSTYVIINGISIFQARRGWSHMLNEVTPLPGNSVYALAVSPDGRVLVGTNQGAAIWTSAGEEMLLDDWQVFTPQNSGLPNKDVISVLVDANSAYWFGTRQGLSVFDGQTWNVYQNEDWDIDGEVIYDIQQGEDGRIWIGTEGGVAVYDGNTWLGYDQDNSGLVDNLILSIEIGSGEKGNSVYFGTGNGLSEFNINTGEWQTVAPDRFNEQSGGISDLHIDSTGKLWVATLGSGIHVWDGTKWNQYSISNSDVPSPRIEQISETTDGSIWISTSFSERPGGLIARFDGQKWKIFRPLYTGYSGASTVAITQDMLGRILFGTLTAGLDLYSQPK